MTQTPDARPIVAAGDVSIDWLAWPLPAEPETGPRVANWRHSEGTRMVARRGGALLLTDLLRQATARPVVGPAVSGIETISPDEHLHSLVDLEVVSAPTGARTFRVKRQRGFCGPEGCDPVRAGLDGPAAGAAILVLDDSGNGFRDDPAAWRDLLAEARPDWLVVKMARPLATGPMWEAARHGPRGADGEVAPDRLIVIVNADDLRAEGIALSRRLSWERTAEDFVQDLGGNGRLDTLSTCAHLIVRFDCDGVIHHRGRDGAPPTLYFDPAHAEGEFIDAQGGRMVGMTAAFTAALAAALVDDPDSGLNGAIRRGMSASRRLAAAGFIEADRGAGRKAPDYPLALTIAGGAETGLVGLPIPAARIEAGESWSILGDTLGDITSAARRIVTYGHGAALARAPVARFGALYTADRREIESFRAIGNLLREYLSAPQTKPISIGVFGPPGAGKSFGVKQVARHAAQGRRLEMLEFNLSQFTDVADLVAAFHLVRDKALGGATPLVFFDEFDAAFRGELGWLRYFLAPMQDGRFLEAGAAHPLGASIFVFAGGTKPSFEKFAAPMRIEDENDDTRRAFIDAKGPDFASRLRGHVDILGPNPTGKTDQMFPIRRAFLLGALLEEREPKLRSGAGHNLDSGVLNALLTTPAYRHGVRSIEAVLAMSSLSGHTQYERADLPPAEQLDLHVDAAAFMARVRGERLDETMREAIGRLLHEAYRQTRRAIARADGAGQAGLDGDKAMVGWDDLSEPLRESNRLQADDIPRKLRRIDCFMGRPLEGREAVTAFEPAEVALLAELEHERFNAERLRDHWRLGPRDPDLRQSPFLIPWADLPPEGRQLDESPVRAIPGVLEAVGCRVYRVG